MKLLAKVSYFNDEEITTIPCDSFTELFQRMGCDASLLGIVAIENTIAGSILPNHELLRQSNMQIVGEHKMHISHVLAALPGQSIDELSEVNSHPMALMQCEQYLRRHSAGTKPRSLWQGFAQVGGIRPRSLRHLTPMAWRRGYPAIKRDHITGGRPCDDCHLTQGY